MSKIKKISSIENMAVFKSFDWNKTLRDKGNNIISFAETNIFYGRNGAGKTTLSRIFRALETGRLSDKYQSPKFYVDFEDNSQLTQANLTGHNHCIRVFNEDFINENLKFFIDENAGISSFAVLGDNNSEITTKIKQLEDEIGNREQNQGLYAHLIQAEIDFNQANAVLSNTEKNLETLLYKKANDENFGIKHNSIFQQANYKVPKLKADIEKIRQNGSYILLENQQDIFKQQIKEESKKNIQEIPIPKFNITRFNQQTKDLVEQQITISEPMQELLNNNLLESWVRQGINLHKDKINTCMFCQNPISTDLWEKLAKHFNQESEDLRQNIQVLLNHLQQEKQKIERLRLLDKQLFYFNFHQDIERIEFYFQQSKDNYIDVLGYLTEKLNQRLENIAHHFEFENILFETENFENLFDEYNEIIKKSNAYTNEITDKQKSAREKLLLNEVNRFINDIQYFDRLKEIEDLTLDREQKEKIKRDKEVLIKRKEEEIKQLKSQLNDETKGAEKVNEFLGHFLTGQTLSLKVQSHSLGVKFEIYRDDSIAYHLSEGERSLIAFCYFIAKLSDLSTQGRKPIIYIDDPICSLDSNHIFFIFSLINSEIFQKIKEQKLFSQLFISTHNLDFFKYLHKFKTRNSRFFLIEKEYCSAKIKEMPNYLERYATEFNYLFENIYKCANINTWNDENYHILYNFGNNARKFLEIYIYYQYPIVAQNIDERLDKFFGQGNIPTFLNRINNEYSHLDGGLERGAIPIDYSEAQLCAKVILDKIEEKNLEQFKALKESIGIID